MKKKRWWALAIFVLLLIIWTSNTINSNQGDIAGPPFMSYISDKEGRQPLLTQVYREGDGKTLALIKLEGVIVDNSTNSSYLNTPYNHKLLLRQLEAAFSREDIQGIILQINSPGGGVYESDEIYNRITDLKNRYKKPLVVYMGQEAASGGYYVSMAADKIYANRNTLTGSIGVILKTYNYKELADKIGVKDVTFKSGAQKDLLNPMQPINDEEQAIMQSLVDESYGYFVDVVAKGRDMDREQVLKLADGRIYTGTQAQKLELVDEVGYLEDAIAGAAELAHTSNPTVILFKNPGPDFLSWLGSMRAPAFDLLGLKQEMEQQMAPELMYIAN